MPAVTLNKGVYYVGNPKDVFPGWKESPSCTYKAGIYTYNAFKFKAGFVAAVPEMAMPLEEVKTNKGDSLKKASPVRMTFVKPVVFFEQNGEGAIDTVPL